MGAFESKLGGDTPKYREFIEYDSEGNPVVLRRSVSLEEQGDLASDLETSIPGEAQEPKSTRWNLGSMRYFCDIKEVSTRLRPKVAES